MYEASSAFRLHAVLRNCAMLSISFVVNVSSSFITIVGHVRQCPLPPAQCTTFIGCRLACFALAAFQGCLRTAFAQCICCRCSPAAGSAGACPGFAAAALASHSLGCGTAALALSHVRQHDSGRSWAGAGSRCTPAHSYVARWLCAFLTTASNAAFAVYALLAK